MIRKSLAVLCVLSLVSVSSVCAQENVNSDASVVLDFQTTDADTRVQTTLDAQPVFFEENGQTFFRATLTLQGAENLTGFNCDLVFDPAVLNVADIHEARGDLNFDGRSNIADILAIAERFNEPAGPDAQNGYSYFDRDASGASANVIDAGDINAVLPFINETSVFWTANQNQDLSQIRESVEIFEDPAVSNAKGRIDDLVVTLLSRQHPAQEGFGFDGDARIADITFVVVGDLSAGTTISFEDVMAIDEATVITQDTITGAGVPIANPVVIAQ